MLERIQAARSIPELEALVYEIRQLPEAQRAMLRIPWRSARELLLRISQAPARSPYASEPPRIYAIEAPHFAAGLEVIGGVVSSSWCAPILRWAAGKPWAQVRAQLERKGYKIS